MTTKKRVLIVDENLHIPFDPRVWLECRALVDAGYDVTAICPKGVKRDTESYEFLEGVHIHRFDVVDADGSGAAGYAREYATALWATLKISLKLGWKNKFDIIHLCNPPDLMILSALPLRMFRGSRIVFDQHDLVPELWKSKFGESKKALYQVQVAAEWFTYRMAHHVISTNESYRQVAMDRGGKKPDEVTVVRSAPEVARVRRVPANESLKNGHKHLAVYVGVMGDQDGVDYAVRAMDELRKLGRDDLQAVFIGSGEALEPCRQLVKDLALEDSVVFTGRIPDEELMELLSTADIGIAPDPRNPLNEVSTMNKILEYMIMGIPIVSFDLREAKVSAGDAAIYAEPNSEKHFAECMIELMDDPARRQEMGRIGKERIAGDLSWAVSRQNLEAAYKAALNA